MNNKTSKSNQKLPLWLKIIFGIGTLYVIAVATVLIIPAFIVIEIFQDRRAEKAINKEFHEEVANIPEIKVDSFTLWEGDSIVHFNIENKGPIYFWYGKSGVPRIEAIGGIGVGHTCFYINKDGIKTGYAGNWSLVLDSDSPYKKWFPFEVKNIQDLVNRYDEIVKVAKSLPKDPEMITFSDGLYGRREVVKNPNPDFVVNRKIDGKDATCDLFQ